MEDTNRITRLPKGIQSLGSSGAAGVQYDRSGESIGGNFGGHRRDCVIADGNQNPLEAADGGAPENHRREERAESARYPAFADDGDGEIAIHIYSDAGHTAIVARNVSQKANRSCNSSLRLLAFSENPSELGPPAT